MASIHTHVHAYTCAHKCAHTQACTQLYEVNTAGPDTPPGNRGPKEIGGCPGQASMRYCAAGHEVRKGYPVIFSVSWKIRFPIKASFETRTIILTHKKQVPSISGFMVVNFIIAIIITIIIIMMAAGGWSASKQSPT